MESKKYYVCREWKSGMIEYQMHKCKEDFCDHGYLVKYPDRVWKFSKTGAQNIVKRGNDLVDYLGEYSAIRRWFILEA